MIKIFEVRDESYHADIQRAPQSEEGKPEIYQVTVRGPDGGSTQGTLKLTEEAIELAGARASKEGGSAEDWIAHGCARSLAAEVLIRKLKPDFSFVVDHRWVGR